MVGSTDMSALTPLRFAAGQFYGEVQLAYSSHGISLTHRIADRSPDEVLEHTHIDAHFVLITGGNYASIATGRPATGCPIFIYNPPGTTHRDHFERGRGSYFAISLEPAKAAAMSGGISLPNEPLHLIKTAQLAIAMRIVKCCSSAVRGLALDALSHELVGSMDRRHPTERIAPNWLHQAMELLHDRYLDELTIADIATSVGVHPIHLARSFRHHFGCSPAEFTRFRRLERAAQMLTRSGNPLSEIALVCGYADQSHFNKEFARNMGVTPRKYRLAAGIHSGTASMFQNDKRLPPKMRKIRAWNAASREMARRHK
jgi:AraC family transcriptional regulator